MKNAAKNFQKIRWRSAAFLLAENAVFLLTVYISSELISLVYGVSKPVR
jgi:hypothetical protein